MKRDYIVNKKYSIKTLVTPSLEYDWIGCFADGLSSVKKHNKYGFIDKRGKLIIPLEYDGSRNFSEGIATVKKNGKWGYIDKAGEIVIPFEYDNAGSLNGGFANVQKANKCGFINSKGRIVIPLDYDNVTHFSGNYARVEKNGKKSIINKTGESIISNDVGYEIVDNVNEGFIRIIYIATEIRFGFIDIAKNIIVPLEYNAANPFREGLAAVSKTVADGNHINSYINQEGDVAFSANYDVLCDFHEGLAAVCNGYRRDRFFPSTDYEVDFNKKLGSYILKKIEHLKHYTLQNFFKEHSKLTRKANMSAYENSKWGFIDKIGKLVIPLEYEYVDYTYYKFSGGIACVKKDGRYGYIDKTGVVVIPIEYHFANDLREGLAVVQKDSKWGIFQIEF